MTLTLAQAQSLVSATLTEAAKLQLKPLAVAVVDAGGHIIAVQRQDGASTLRPEIALGKAAGALSLGISSRFIAQLAAKPPPITAVGQIAARGVAPSPGGLIIVDAVGNVIGAAGASGDTGDNDEICVRAGITAIGMNTKHDPVLS